MSDTSSIVLHKSPIVDNLLKNRGISTQKEADEFLFGDYEAGLHDPYLLNDMEIAVERIIKALDNNEHIVIFSDYDCDGIPGAVVLHDFFKAVSHENFSNYIPHRHFEGFGFSAEAVEKMSAKNPALIITIDCGTTNHQAVEFASSRGIDVIITDHHEPMETLPNALAVVNPKVGTSYPFSGLCGAGVIFKLVQALIATDKFALPPGQEKWWLDMVGIATIADMVPLTGENRILARYGLTVLRKSRRPGLIALLHKQRASQKHLTEDDIGFTIGPRINAASRMDAPEDAFRLLATDDEVEAATLVDHLEKLNNERKGSVAAMTREAHGSLKHDENIPEVLVIGNPLWRPSLVGLVANKLAEEHNKPAFVWGRDGNGVLKGSARSNGVVSVVRLMEKGNSAFLEYGGHHFSGGFSINEDSIHNLSKILNDSFASLGEEAVFPSEIVVDAEILLEDLKASLVEDIISLSPFGTGNTKPVFRFTNITPDSILAFGKGGIHTKMFFKSGLGKIEAISFFTAPEKFGLDVSLPAPLTLLANIERSYFMGRLQTRLKIVAIE